MEAEKFDIIMEAQDQLIFLQDHVEEGEIRCNNSDIPPKPLVIDNDDEISSNEEEKEIFLSN